MLKTPIAPIVDILTQSLLRRGDDKHVLIIYLKVTLEDSKETSHVRFLTFFVYRPSAYTLVGVEESESIIHRTDAKYRQTSYHDSSWRSDGIHSPISDLYFRMCRDHQPEMAPYRVAIEAEFWRGPEVIEVESVTFVDQSKPIEVVWKN